MGRQVVPPSPAATPWYSLPVQRQEHGLAMVTPVERGVGVVAILLNAFLEPAVDSVDPLSGQVCEEAAGPATSACQYWSPPPCTHRPVELAPAAHGHKEACMHSLEGHDTHADGADLNDACRKELS